jgi:hypothetical protein
MSRLAAVTAVLCALPTGATADGVKPSPTACVNREHTEWRQVRDPILDAKALQYCTGNDCWSLDLATAAITSVPRRTPSPMVAGDPAGSLTDGHGTTIATADDTHAEFCPHGEAASCKSIKYKVAAPAAAVFPHVNAAFTLGAVFYRGVGDNDVQSYLVAFDLVTGKQLGQIPGENIEVLDHGFLVDQVTLYSAAFKKIGKLAAPDQVWVKLGSTDRIALRDKVKGQILIQDTTTAKVKARIPTGVADRTTFFTLVPTSDGATLYAIGWASDEGEVLVIDVATAKITARLTPPVCAAGTHRVN